MVNQEHQMPHRCGIITARPAKPEVIAVQPEEGTVHQSLLPPTSKLFVFCLFIVMTYLEGAKKKITPLMEEAKLISDDEANELGKKDVDG